MNVASHLSMSKERGRTEKRSNKRRGNYGDFEKVLKRIEETKMANENLLQRVADGKLLRNKGGNDTPSSNAEPFSFHKNRDAEEQTANAVPKRKARFAKLVSSVACVGRVTGISNGGAEESRDDLEDSCFEVGIVEQEQWMEPKPIRSRSIRRVRFACDEKEKRRPRSSAEESLGVKYETSKKGYGPSARMGL